jgi:hypothetical protein
MVLVDTLPKGLAYDMQSLMLNGSAVPGLTGQSRALHLELPVRQVDSLDTVTVYIVRDTSFAKRVGVARPKLVLSYPERRDAVFRTVETFAIPGDHSLGTLAPRPASNEASLGAERKGQKGSE